jgi:hypothetical protein
MREGVWEGGREGGREGRSRKNVQLYMSCNDGFSLCHIWKFSTSVLGGMAKERKEKKRKSREGGEEEGKMKNK